MIAAAGGTVQAGAPVVVAPSIASLSILSAPADVSVTIAGAGVDNPVTSD